MKINFGTHMIVKNQKPIVLFLADVVSSNSTI